MQEPLYVEVYLQMKQITYGSETGRIPNEKLVERIQTGQEVQLCLCQLWQQNSGLLHKLIMKYLPEEPEDGLQEAFFAVQQAACRYDPDSGMSFCGYLALWTRAVLLRYKAKTALVQIPEYQRAALRKLSRLRTEYLKRVGSEPELVTLADLAGIDIADLDSLRVTERAAGRAASLDRPLTEDGGDPVTLGEILPGGETADAETLEEIELQELSALLREWLQEIEGGEIIRRKWLDGLPLDQIAAETGQTVEQCKKAERQAMKIMRNPKNQRELMTRLPERFRAMAYHGSGLQAFK